MTLQAFIPLDRNEIVLFEATSYVGPAHEFFIPCGFFLLEPDTDQKFRFRKIRCKA